MVPPAPAPQRAEALDGLDRRVFASAPAPALGQSPTATPGQRAFSLSKSACLPTCQVRLGSRFLSEAVLLPAWPHSFQDWGRWARGRGRPGGAEPGVPKGWGRVRPRFPCDSGPGGQSSGCGSLVSISEEPSAAYDFRGPAAGRGSEPRPGRALSGTLQASVPRLANKRSEPRPGLAGTEPGGPGEEPGGSGVRGRGPGVLEEERGEVPWLSVQGRR